MRYSCVGAMNMKSGMDLVDPIIGLTLSYSFSG